MLDAPKRLNREQLRALNSLLRQEIVTCLRAEGAGSAKELSERLGMDEMLLYYHLRVLAKAGLIHVSGSRPTATKRETVYEAMGPGMVDDLDLDDDDVLQELTRNVDTILKSTSKEYRLAVEVLRKASFDECSLARLTLSLNSDQKIALDAKIAEVIDAARAGQDPQGKKYNLTLVFTPIVRPH